MDDKSSETVAKVDTNSDSMRAIEKDEFDDLTFWQAIKKWKHIFWYSMLLSTTIIMYGYDYVIVATVSAMPSFQRDFGQTYKGMLIIPSLWLGLWTFISPGASMPGSIIGGYVQDMFGRRWSFIIGTFISAVAVAICYVSNLSDDINTRRGIFLAGKGLQGGAIGMVMTTCQTYMSEVLPPKLRGPLLAFFSIFTLVGQLIGSGVIFACLDMDNGYVIGFATQWLFSGIPLIISFIIPESPVYLIRKNKFDQARKAQLRLQPNVADAEKTLDSIKADIEHERKQSGATYWDCFRPVHARRTWIVLYASIMPLIFGLTLLAQASYFAQVVGMDADASVIILLLGITLGLIANIASMWVLMKVGRRRLVIVSFAVLAVLWASVGIAGIFDGKPTTWFCAVVMILITVIAGLSCWPASYVISSEVSALHLRGKVQGLGWFISGAVNAVMGFVLPYMYNPDEGNLKAKTGFVFAGFCAVAWVASYYWIPELKGRTASETDRMFELNLPAKAFKTWSSDQGAALNGNGKDTKA